MIVSDSVINVDIFHKTRKAALGSSNGVLWKIIYDHIDRKSLRVRLFWVPGHLDVTTV